VLAAVADYDAVMVSLIGDVATNYVLVRAFQERLGFTRANAALQQDTLALTETRFRAGAVSELDVATARATLAATNAGIPVLEDQLRAAKLALCVLLGRTPSTLDAEFATAQGQPARVPDAPASIAAGIPADLLRRRPDVRFAERFAAAQSARIGVAMADLYPAISVTGSTGFAGAEVHEGNRHLHLGDIAESDAWQGFVGLGVRWPILNYQRIENNIRVEDALYEQAVTDYKQTVLAAAADVEAGLSTFLRSREQSAFLAEAVAATQRTAEISLIQYRTGAVDFIRVNTAQTDLVEQQDLQVQARAATALGAIRTFRALGGGWEVRAGREYVDPDTVRRMTERTDWGDVLDPDWQNWTDWERFPRPESPPAGTEPAPQK
jgi:NodT family efflux transporter outer membrane factor (OMF) lipoprotein